MKQENRPLYMEHFREITQYMMNGVVEMVKHADDSFEIVFANETAGNLLFNKPVEDTKVFANDPYAFVYPADRERVKEAILACRKEEHVKETYRVLDRNGEIVWVLAHLNAKKVGDDLHIVIVYSNVSELMGTQAKLQSEGDKLLDIMNSIPVGVAIYEIDDEGKCSVLSINDQLVAFANTVGRDLDGNARSWSKEELTVLFNQSIYAFCTKGDIPVVSEMLEKSKECAIANCVFRLRGSREDKTIYVKSTCYSKQASEHSRNYYITFENVTKDKLQEIELVKKQEQLLEYSYYDALTHVKNRHSYNEFVAECRQLFLHDVGVLFADLNGLKRVNDMLGHQYGDSMITRFINILTRYFDFNSIFRISGDEFVVVCSATSREDFVSKVEALIVDLHQNEDLASIGYIWEEAVKDVKLVVSKAEQIMYVEKQKFYEIEKSLRSKHRPLLLNSLLADLENGRFEMYLQPKADVESEKIIGAEALVRRKDETGKIIPPIEFIPQLEKERLVPKIDFFMLEEVCKFLEVLKKEGKTDFRISVNMSRVTLVEHDYMDIIESILNKYDFDINQLEFEITESNETMDSRRLEDYILKIKKLGIRISLDDVGTDYSSFPMLILEGIDCVKLDRSLIIKMNTPKANKLLSHMTNMCHDLEMEVIAEGIETKEDLKTLRSLGCDSFQGYLLSKPVPVTEFVKKFM